MQAYARVFAALAVADCGGAADVDDLPLDRALSLWGLRWGSYQQVSTCVRRAFGFGEEAEAASRFKMLCPGCTRKEKPSCRGGTLARIPGTWADSSPQQQLRKHCFATWKQAAHEAESLTQRMSCAGTRTSNPAAVDVDQAAWSRNVEGISCRDAPFSLCQEEPLELFGWSLIGKANTFYHLRAILRCMSLAQCRLIHWSQACLWPALRRFWAT